MTKFIIPCLLILITPFLKAQCYLPTIPTDRGFIGYAAQRELWKSQIIPYEFHENFPSFHKDTILKALGTIQANTNLCFIPWQNEDRKMLIKSFNNPLYSYAGFSDQSINLSYYEKPTVIHEVCHLLGMAHEHQRPDRGQHIAVFYTNIIPGFESAFDKIPLDSSMLISPEYDIKSIMHYSSSAFSKNGSPTITDVAWNQFDRNTELSAGDIALLNQAYPLKIDCAKAAFERPPEANILEEGGKVCSYTLRKFRNFSFTAASSKWSAPGAVPETGNDSVFIAYFPKAGTYKITLEASNAYGSSTQEVSVSVTDCVEPAIVSISPNPATERIDITLSQLIPAEFGLRLFTMGGQQLVNEQAKTQNLGSKTYTYQLPPSLPKAYYMLVLDVYNTMLSYPVFVNSP